MIRVIEWGLIGNVLDLSGLFFGEVHLFRAGFFNPG